MSAKDVGTASAEPEAVPAAVEEDRRHLVEAAIVRTMKVCMHVRV